MSITKSTPKAPPIFRFSSPVLENVPSDESVKIQPFDLLCVFNKERFADIHFIVGNDNQKRIPAHKVILSARSTVFEAMFYGPLATKSEEIEVPDVEPSGFLALLKFFYSNEVDICTETVSSTLYAANKYNESTLEKCCVDFLKKNLAYDNVFFSLELARLFNKPQLEAMCLDMIDKNTIHVLSADSFTDIDFETLIFFLERNTLQVFESKLFQAIVAWSKAECNRKKLNLTAENQRKVLDRALKLIRFPLMTIKEFITGPIRSELLSDAEVKQFCLDIISNANSTEIPRCSNSPLQCHLKFIGESGTLIKKGIGYLDSIQFFRPVFIVGFNVLNIMKYKSKVKLGLSQHEMRFGMIQMCTSSTCLGTIPIMFNRPILVKPDKDIQIGLEIDESANHPTWRMTQNGIIHGYNGQKLDNMNANDYFKFINCSGIIADIIFFV